jgi:hypothetical protein
MSPRPRRAKSDDEPERGARSLIGASREVATSTITGVPNTCISARPNGNCGRVSSPRRYHRRVKRTKGQWQ